MMWLIVVAVGVLGGRFIYQAGYNRGHRQGLKWVRPRLPAEPARDPYGWETGRLRTAEAMREAAAHVCRLVSRDAANKARVAGELATGPRHTEEERNKAVARQKAWLYTCEAAERCEREVRALGLYGEGMPHVIGETDEAA